VIVSELMSRGPSPSTLHADDAALPELFAYADSTCRGAAELMATEGVASIPVVDRVTGRVSGTLTLQDLLRGRSKAVVRESERLRLFDHRDGTGV
jgi:CBS domain-containing protein